MAKIKVHELAKELGVDRKTVVSYLREKGYDSMTAVTMVPEQEVANIRSRFGTAKPEAKPEVVSIQAPKQETAGAPVKTDEAPKRKSKGIVIVNGRKFMQK